MDMSRPWPEQPLAHLEFRTAEGGVEPVAAGGGDDGEEEGVGVLTLEHEVDAEEEGGEDVEDVGEPVGEGGEEVAGGGGNGSLEAGGDGVETELVSHGDVLDLADKLRESLGELGEGFAEVAQDGRQGEEEEEGEHTGDAEEHEDDGDGT